MGTRMHNYESVNFLQSNHALNYEITSFIGLLCLQHATTVLLPLSARWKWLNGLMQGRSENETINGVSPSKCNHQVVYLAMLE